MSRERTLQRRITPTPAAAVTPANRQRADELRAVAGRLRDLQAGLFYDETHSFVAARIAAALDELARAEQALRAPRRYRGILDLRS